jgi:hypothetical protein
MVKVRNSKNKSKGIAVKKTANKMKFRMDQLALVVAVFALVGVGALAVSQARQGNTSNSTVSVGGYTVCNGKAWTVNARAWANNVALMNVDIYDTPSASSSSFHLVASNISLPYGLQDPYTFQTHPESGVKKYDVVVVGHGGSPTANEVFGAFRLLNTCI